MFAWLVTMVLHETPQMVGVAQMAMLVPVMLLMLFGGGVADALGGRRIAILAQSFAVVPSIGLLLVLAFDALDFRLMIIYAVAMGCATAFVTPARDGLLNLVAEGRIQRTVTLVSLIQFGVQMIGFTVAGLAGRIGPLAVIGFQTAVLIVGAVAYTRLPAPPVRSVVMPSLRDLVGSVLEGSQTVLRSDAMRPVVVQNIAMGICFMGSYIVAMPLLVREVYQGDAADLSMVMIANALGLVTSILLLLLGGGLRRQGRALLLAHFLGCIFLAAAGLDFGFWAAIGCIYLWGACGGVAMSMSRTIMQEAAPDGQRGRVMAFFSFSFMGAGPLGALIAGYLVGWVGPPIALFISSATLMVVIVAVALTSSLWNMTADAFLATSRSEPRQADETRQAAG